MGRKIGGNHLEIGFDFANSTQMMEKFARTVEPFLFDACSEL